MLFVKWTTYLVLQSRKQKVVQTRELNFVEKSSARDDRRFRSAILVRDTIRMRRLRFSLSAHSHSTIHKAAPSQMAAVVQPVLTEQTSLLPQDHISKNKRTPLPWKQLSIILLIQTCEPIASQSIYPYINQAWMPSTRPCLAESCLVDQRARHNRRGREESWILCWNGANAMLIVEYILYRIHNSHSNDHVVIQEALFFLTEAMATLQWSRASDVVGRKPILLIGIFGTALSIFCFGLSRTFVTLVISRCLCGLLSGNVGVMKSALGDLTDRTNRAEAFVFLPIVWAAGASIGPLIGGSLARPHDRFPHSHFFSSRFWLEFPYFLPCLVTGSIVVISWFIVLLFFRETVPWKTHKQQPSEPGTPSLESPPSTPSPRQGPLPMRQLLTQPVLLSISNYVALGFLNTSLAALIPLFLTMPIGVGGLGLDPPQIGLILSAYGVATGCFNLLFFARLVRWVGEKRTFMIGMSTNFFVFLLFPIMNLLAKANGELWWGIYALIGCLLLSGAIMDISFSSIFIFVIASSPKSSRGTVNGLSQTSVSIARAIGPALGTSLFSISVQKNLLGGYFVYAVFFVLSCGAMWLAGRLPEEVWDDIE
ncbi:Major facilitator superfamily multidrug-resistance DHA1 sub-family [Mycena indigotica]|uniref:Major facilitator superfamily multidrug-resistance DHA1 sub-family n=1 Tax=Mycena indigotica TaxID=2126181 RepID=A0A8H6T6W4_9AGAR|nr:Major facilitator superfamily multidrug-resistance DHA1 sub-family [Mycena indigotica]KAF7312036.1 Major facilitator superfamily multidrug-resistance DHA1 sub-family [Mycena indigotica]